MQFSGEVEQDRDRKGGGVSPRGSFRAGLGKHQITPHNELTSKFFFASTFTSDLTGAFMAGGEVPVDNMASVSVSHTQCRGAVQH